MKLLRELLFPVIAVLMAFVVGGIIVWLIGDNPFEVYGLLLGSALTWPDGIGYTLFYATPLIFTGLAVAVAFRCGLLNIGAEGQLYVAAFACAWVSIKLGGTVIKGFDGNPIGYGGTSLPALVLVPLAVLTAIAVGAAWGAIPGWLKARFGAHEVITTIMMNFLAPARPHHAERPRRLVSAHRTFGSVRAGAAGTSAAQRRVPARPTRVRARLRLPVADEVGLRDTRDGREPFGG